jgi:hypothetical protein
VLEAAFVLLEFSSPSKRIFIGSHSLPPLSGSPYRSFSHESSNSSSATEEQRREGHHLGEERVELVD